jgi:hypothetical protein
MKMSIPKDVTAISADAFYDCINLMSIDVAEDNPAYSSEDGVLFNKDKTVLIQYPRGKKGAYTIPDSVTEICGGAFYNCDGLTSLICRNPVPPKSDGFFFVCDLFGEDDVKMIKTCLYVPERSIEAYRRVPGWREFRLIRGLRDVPKL